jgi:hypothetical protein
MVSKRFFLRFHGIFHLPEFGYHISPGKNGGRTSTQSPHQRRSSVVVSFFCLSVPFEPFLVTPPVKNTRREIMIER